jgi:polysaccharide biosynthesis protein
MNLLKTSVLNGIAVLIKTATMFILNKILAIYIGPSGYVAIGQYQNFIQIVTNFSGSAINTGVIKYTAEYNGDVRQQHYIWKNAIGLISLFSLLFAFLLFIFNKDIAIYLFQNPDYSSIINWFALFLLFFNLNAFFIAILNGKKEVIRLVIANIVGSLFALVITVLLAIQYQLYGALVSLSIYQSLAFFVTLFLCLKTEWFKLNYFTGKLDKTGIKRFLPYILMALVSAICIPFSQIVIRSYLSSEYSVTQAGYWEALVRLSNAYLMLITTTLSVYYLPRLAELFKLEEIKAEVYQGYKYIFPAAIVFGVTMYLLRDYVITILFTEEFLPMRELFAWQLIGDSLKIGSWILAYLMLSKTLTKLFIYTEIVFAITSVLFVVLFTQLFGFEYVSLAHAANYALYWVVMGVFIFKQLEKRLR